MSMTTRSSRRFGALWARWALRPSIADGGVGGSQELDEIEVKIARQTVLLELETYMGIAIAGPGHLVDAIVDNVSALSDQTIDRS